MVGISYVANTVLICDSAGCRRSLAIRGKGSWRDLGEWDPETAEMIFITTVECWRCEKERGSQPMEQDGALVGWKV
jgi:hypothetical protein